MEDTITLKGVKFLDVGFVTALYFSAGFVVAQAIEAHLGEFVESEADSKPTWKIALELLLQLWVAGVLTYLVKGLVSGVPFPLNGFNGYNHSKLEELNNTFIFTLALLAFQPRFRSSLTYLVKRLKKK